MMTTPATLTGIMIWRRHNPKNLPKSHPNSHGRIMILARFMSGLADIGKPSRNTPRRRRYSA